MLYDDTNDTQLYNDILTSLNDFIFLLETFFLLKLLSPKVRGEKKTLLGLLLKERGKVCNLY